MRLHFALLAAVASGAFLLGGCSSNEPEREPVTVKGTVYVTGQLDLVAVMSDECKVLEFGDIETGAPIEITDGTGKTLAFGKLEAGKDGGNNAKGRTCTFQYEIDDVPAGEKVYKVKAGDQSAHAFAEDDFAYPVNLRFVN